MDELGAGPAVVEAGQEPGGEGIARREQALEGDRMGDRAVVEEERERPAGGPGPPVGATRVDPPPPTSCHSPSGSAPHPARLLGRQDGEGHAVVGEDLERLLVHRGLRQPHPFRLAPEAVAEVGEAPPHLGDLVAPGGEGQDQVVVRLGDGVPVTAPGRDAGPIGLEDPRVHVGPLGLEPGEQGRPDVEGDPLEVVGDVGDPVPGVHPAGRGVRRVALGRHARVPVVVRIRRVLRLHDLEPGVLARGLVEVTVDRDVARVAQTEPSMSRLCARPPRGRRRSRSRRGPSGARLPTGPRRSRSRGAGG